MPKVSYEQKVDGRRTGKAPARSHPLMLNFSDFVKEKIEIPEETIYWERRKDFPLRMFANDKYGCCTRAKQAIAAMRMERIEQRKTIDIPDEEVVRVYFEMTEKLYGGGDTGAYEQDALDAWRRPDSTFKDTKGRPFTIDAYTKVNQGNIEEIKKAIWLSQSHGIALCFNLPAAFANATYAWDIPEGQQPIGDWLPGSWGGHSTWGVEYDAYGVTVPTWDLVIKVSWRAMAIYCDEAFSIVDSIDAWKKRKLTADNIDLTNLRSAVNEVSSVQI